MSTALSSEPTSCKVAIDAVSAAVAAASRISSPSPTRSRSVSSGSLVQVRLVGGSVGLGARRFRPVPNETYARSPGWPSSAPRVPSARSASSRRPEPFGGQASDVFHPSFAGHHIADARTVEDSGVAALEPVVVTCQRLDVQALPGPGQALLAEHPDPDMLAAGQRVHRLERAGQVARHVAPNRSRGRQGCRYRQAAASGRAHPTTRRASGARLPCPATGRPTDGGHRRGGWLGASW